MQYISEQDAAERYDEFLDEIGDVKIGELSYSASRVLKEVDPTAYRCGMADWLDSEELTTDESEADTDTDDDDDDDD